MFSIRLKFRVIHHSVVLEPLEHFDVLHPFLQSFASLTQVTTVFPVQSLMFVRTALGLP